MFKVAANQKQMFPATFKEFLKGGRNPEAQNTAIEFFNKLSLARILSRVLGGAYVKPGKNLKNGHFCGFSGVEPQK